MASSTIHLTQEQLTAAIGHAELVQICGTGGVNTPEGRSVDQAKLSPVLERVNGMVEGYVRSRYPLGTTAQLLTSAAADMARYFLRTDLNNGTVSDDVRRRHEDAMKTLRDVQAGKLALHDAAGASAGPADSPTGQVGTLDGVPRPRTTVSGLADDYRNPHHV